MAIIHIGFGFLLSLAGRPAYFVFTGAAAYLVGRNIADRFPLVPGQWNSLVVPLFFALIGAGLAFALKRWAAWAAGFIAGGYLVYHLPGVFAAQPTWVSPLAFVIAGAVCVLLLVVAFDLFLTFLSAVTGVTMMLTEIHFNAIEPTLMFLIFLMVGLIVQYLMFEYGKPSPD